MDYEAACCTDRGSRKEVNQDSACVMIADSSYGPVCMAFLCDGMGGISLGEYASAAVIKVFVQWFEEVLPERMEQGISLERMAVEWVSMLEGLDKDFREYGHERGLKLGTTATGMLFLKDRYLLIQSGDSRAYEIGRTGRQLSEDQSYVQQQVNMGLLTQEEARYHPKRNILLNCIGGSRPSTPEWRIGKVNRKSNYLLCSDGLVHEVGKEEISYFLMPRLGIDISRMQEKLGEMISLAKSRGEKDNITAVVIQAVSSKKRIMKKEFYFHIREKNIVTEGSITTEQELVVTEVEE